MSKHGKDNHVTLATGSGSFNLSPYCSQCTYGLTADSHDITTFGQATHVYGPGLLDGTISLEGVYEVGSVTGSPHNIIYPLRGASPSPSFIHGPEGNTSGKPKTTVLVNVTSYEETNPVADYIRWTAEFQMTGPVVTGSF